MKRHTQPQSWGQDKQQMYRKKICTDAVHIRGQHYLLILSEQELMFWF